MKEAWDSARSIESYDGDYSDLEEIGGQQSAVNPDKYYILYKDKQGRHWYKTEYWTDAGPLTEFEYIFGHKPKRTSKRGSARAHSSGSIQERSLCRSLAKIIYKGD